MQKTKYAAHLIIKTSESVKKKANRLLKPFRITIEQYAVLQRIHEGFDTSSKILSVWGGTKSALANKLAELEKKGLIKRAVSLQDKRIWIFTLQKKGVELINTVQPKHEALVSDLFKNLNNQEIKELIRVFEKLNPNSE